MTTMELLTRAKAAKGAMALANTDTKNAALLAMEMLAISDDTLAQKLADKRAADTAAVLAKNAAVEAEFNK